MLESANPCDNFFIHIFGVKLMFLRQQFLVGIILVLTACQPSRQSQHPISTLIEVPSTKNSETPTIIIRSVTSSPTATYVPSATMFQPTITITPTTQFTPTSESTKDGPLGDSIIIDHTSLELFDQIPDEYIRAASQLRLMVRGASVEDNINLGLDCLWGNFSGRRPSRCFNHFNLKYDRSNWSFQFRSNPGWIDKVIDFIEQADIQIQDYDISSFTFGYVDGFDGGSYPIISNPENFQNFYVDKIEILEANHPDKIFFMWTMSLARLGYENTQNFNTMVREYANKNGKILFDIADIESHDPGGNRVVNDQGYEIIYHGYTNEERSGHLNREGQEIMSKAVWVLMARIAGWDGEIKNTP